MTQSGWFVAGFLACLGLSAATVSVFVLAAVRDQERYRDDATD